MERGESNVNFGFHLYVKFCFGDLRDKLVKRHVVLDIFRDQVAIIRWHGLEVAGGEGGVRREFGELLALYDVTHAVAGDVGLEVVLDRRE